MPSALTKTNRIRLLIRESRASIQCILIILTSPQRFPDPLSSPPPSQILFCFVLWLLLCRFVFIASGVQFVLPIHSRMWGSSSGDWSIYLGLPPIKENGLYLLQKVSTVRSSASAGEERPRASPHLRLEFGLACSCAALMQVTPDAVSS